MLRISSYVSQEMIQHAKAEFPLECCGILAGTGDDISHIYKMTNVDSSRVTYLMDPKEQISVFKEMRTRGIEMKVIYHSHPRHPAYPSSTDIELAYYPDVVYIIISIYDNKDVKVGGFRIIEGEITEVDLDFIKAL